MWKLILFILLLTAQFVKAQWPVIYGQNNSAFYPYYLKETYDKGFLICYSYKIPANGILNSGIQKVDINGNQLWKKTMQNNYKYLNISQIETTNNNEYVIAGRTNQFDNDADPFVMKLSSCFEPEWCNIYRTPNFYDSFIGIVNLPVEDTYILAQFNSDSLENRIELLKIDSMGNTLWKNTYASNPEYTSEFPISLHYSSCDTSVVLSGFVVVEGHMVPYWLKVSTLGEFLWEVYDIPDSSFVWGDVRNHLIVRENGSIISPIASNPQMIGKLVELQSHGNITGVYNLYKPDTMQSEIVNSMNILNNNLYIGLQYFHSGEYGDGKGVIQKTDTLGNLNDEAILPLDFTSLVFDMLSTSDNKILVSSTHDINNTHYMLIKYNEDLEYDSINTQPLIYDSLCPEGITSGTIPLNCNVIVSTCNLKGNTTPKLTLAPNPAHDFTIIYLPEGIYSSQNTDYFDVIKYRTNYIKDLTIEIYDSNGINVYKNDWPDNSKEMVLQTSSLHSGLNFIRIIDSRREVIATGKLMILNSD